jgi:hypothetical protein
MGDLEFELGRFISFRDRAACERVRKISPSEIVRHPNPAFRISVVDDAGAFYRALRARSGGAGATCARRGTPVRSHPPGGADGAFSEYVPGSILQTARTDSTLLAGVADDIAIHIT